jgi:formylglycine-generating enzyme required for sulfatase activity
MAKRPAERFQKPADFVVALKRFEREAPSSPARVTIRDSQGVSSGEIPTIAYRADPSAVPAATGMDSLSRPILSSLTNLVGIKMVLVPPGSFIMGAPETEPGQEAGESPVHMVTITRPFFISACPITQGQFKWVMGHNPSHFSIKNGGSEDHPVETVSWHDARAFCDWLSALDTELMEGQHYRVPTEAEWEYACRAGTQGAYSFGNDISALLSFGWYRDNAGGVTQATGQLRPNPWGLYDMHGNVRQWCLDFYKRKYYADSATADPKGPRSGRYRVVRGGSWYNEAKFCRSAHRGRYLPDEKSRLIGFRVVCAAEPGNPESASGERS